MNWNRPNGGYEREPWQKEWKPNIKKRTNRNESSEDISKAFHYSYPTWKKIEPKMTDELRKKIQALRIK